MKSVCSSTRAIALESSMLTAQGKEVLEVALRSHQTTAREQLGFRDGERGTHSSRSLMLSDIEVLLEHAQPEMTMADYRRLVVSENVLRKPTHTTREHTVRKLKALYGLDPHIPVFRSLVRLWQIDSESHPLLAMLCAHARDPLLRLVSPSVLAVPVGTVVRPCQIIDLLNKQIPGRFSETNAKAIASRILSSFEQSGHLKGKTRKVRTRPNATPINATYAFYLAYLEGYRAQRIFTSPWPSLLDVPSANLNDLAQAASRQGLCTFRQLGDVIELRFPELLTPEEEEQTHVQQD